MPFDLSADFGDIIAPADVAIYGGICALATFDRTELRTRVLDNISFRSFLELCPELREARERAHTPASAHLSDVLSVVQPRRPH